MEKLVAVLVAVLVSPLVAEAASTINSANAASYGANIGWINFEATGNPRLRFADGRMEGFASVGELRVDQSRRWYLRGADRHDSAGP